jgi:hypothetical protein
MSQESPYLIYPLFQRIGVGVQYLNLLQAVVVYIVVYLLYPIVGWITDVWVGH